MKATTTKYYWHHTASWPAVQWQPSACWVIDGKYWTASGVTAGMDMALGFKGDYFGTKFALKDYLLGEIFSARSQ